VKRTVFGGTFNTRRRDICGGDIGGMRGKRGQKANQMKKCLFRHVPNVVPALIRELIFWTTGLTKLSREVELSRGKKKERGGKERRGLQVKAVLGESFLPCGRGWKRNKNVLEIS